MWLYCVKGTGKIEEHKSYSTSCFLLNASIHFLNCIKPHDQYSCFSCKQTVMDRCNLLLTFPVYRGPRVHTLPTQQIYVSTLQEVLLYMHVRIKRSCCICTYASRGVAILTAVPQPVAVVLATTVPEHDVNITLSQWHC